MEQQNTITEADVYDRLKQVIDPETQINIVDMGFIRQIRLTPDAPTKLWVRYTLTTPGCPLAGTIQARIRAVFSDIPGWEASESILTELTFDEPWSLEDMSPEARAELGFL